MRQQLHALLSSRIDGTPPPADAVQGVDRWVHRAWAGRSLGVDGWMHWRDDARDALLPLKRIALDASDLLGDPAAPRLYRCANTTSCGWLFVDTWLRRCSAIGRATEANAGRDEDLSLIRIAGAQAGHQRSWPQ